MSYGLILNVSSRRVHVVWKQFNRERHESLCFLSRGLELLCSIKAFLKQSCVFNHIRLFVFHACLKTLRLILCFLCFFFLRGLFASNYTEIHYLEDGSAVTGSHNSMVCFKQTHPHESVMFPSLSPTRSALTDAFIEPSLSVCVLRHCAHVGVRWGSRDRRCSQTNFFKCLELGSLAHEQSCVGEWVHFLLRQKVKYFMK